MKGLVTQLEAEVYEELYNFLPLLGMSGTVTRKLYMGGVETLLKSVVPAVTGGGYKARVNPNALSPEELEHLDKLFSLGLKYAVVSIPGFHPLLIGAFFLMSATFHSVEFKKTTEKEKERYNAKRKQTEKSPEASKPDSLSETVTGLTPATV